MSPQPRSRFGHARWPANVTTRAWIFFAGALLSTQIRIGMGIRLISRIRRNFA